MFTLNLDKEGADSSLNGFEFCFKHLKQSLMFFRTVCGPLGTQNH